LFWPLYHKGLTGAAEIFVLLEGSAISTEEILSSVRVTMGFLITFLTKALFPMIDRFGLAASSRKSLGGSKLLPFKNDGGHCVLGDLIIIIIYAI
jgi:hypothetical protein